MQLVTLLHRLTRQGRCNACQTEPVLNAVERSLAYVQQILTKDRKKKRRKKSRGRHADAKNESYFMPGLLMYRSVHAILGLIVVSFSADTNLPRILLTETQRMTRSSLFSSLSFHRHKLLPRINRTHFHRPEPYPYRPGPGPASASGRQAHTPKPILQARVSCGEGCTASARQDATPFFSPRAGFHLTPANP